MVMNREYIYRLCDIFVRWEMVSGVEGKWMGVVMDVE